MGLSFLFLYSAVVKMYLVSQSIASIQGQSGHFELTFAVLSPSFINKYRKEILFLKFSLLIIVYSTQYSVWVDLFTTRTYVTKI